MRAAIRVPYERLFTLPEAACVSLMKATPIGMRNRPCQVRGQGVPISVPGVEHSLAGVGGLDYAAYEACFEAKISKGSRTGSGSRRRVFVAGGRRIRRNRCAGRGSAVVGYLPASNHSQ